MRRARAATRSLRMAAVASAGFVACRIRCGDQRIEASAFILDASWSRCGAPAEGEAALGCDAVVARGRFLELSAKAGS